MEECLTCKCGCQEWIVFDDRFECSSCRKTVKAFDLVFIERANQMIEESKT